MKDIKTRFPLLIDLTRLRMSLFVTFSAWAGFILASKELSQGVVPLLPGVFLLASGASGLNQYQERREDKKMRRTKGRPIPSGNLSPSSALKLSLLLLLLGFSILWVGTNRMALGLGIFAVLCYNGIYTPLKKRTALAILPGALVGAIPPAIGWFSGGGRPDGQLLAIALFFFIWQIPHFWLLLLDYRRDYEKAGFPAVTQAWGLNQAGRISFVWIFATAVAGLLTPLFGGIHSNAILGGLVILSLWLIWNVWKRLLNHPLSSPFHPAFRAVNIYILTAMVLFSLDHLLY